MAGILDDIGKMSILRLSTELIKNIKRLIGLEKDYVKQELIPHIKGLSPWIILLTTGIVFLCLGLLCLIPSAILFLNIWFTPWASALLVALALIAIGIILGLIGAYNSKKSVSKAQGILKEVGEDLKCLKKK
ncbi:MAG: phage holin family protein [Deltaproteobacteria bacterium]|nr:phage holin family protein [Deltaproteobacteria bacterium]